MERRREPRFESGEPVEAHILGRDPAVLPARIQNVSGRGMRLLLDRPLSPGAALMIKTGAASFLGEVCYCEPLPQGHAVGLVLDQVLYQSAELQALCRALQDQPAPAGGSTRAAAHREAP